jgi:hypothetical protein
MLVYQSFCSILFMAWWMRWSILIHRNGISRNCGLLFNPPANSLARWSYFMIKTCFVVCPWILSYFSHAIEIWRVRHDFCDSPPMLRDISGSRYSRYNIYIYIYIYTSIYIHIYIYMYIVIYWYTVSTVRYWITVPCFDAAHCCRWWSKQAVSDLTMYVVNLGETLSGSWKTMIRKKTRNRCMFLLLLLGKL